MKNKIVANGDMNDEESTLHVIKGTRCGDILSITPSKMEIHFGHRIYQCTGCKSKWKFGE